MLSRCLALAFCLVAAGSTGAMAQTATPPVAAAPAATPAGPPFVIPFTRGSTSVNTDMEAALDRAVAYAQSNRTMGVVITGIADARGSDSSRASRARAMANNVRSYFRDNGVPESRTTTAAEGDASPTAVNRVEITFVPR
jgi:outer membrane protein OmpA-like peptidoglycan-associated protein